MDSGEVLHRSRFHTIGRIVSVAIIIVTVIVIGVTFMRSRRQTRPPGLLRSSSALNADVTSIIENYSTVRSENGRETLRLKAARDIAYADGHHELEEVDLLAYGAPVPGGEPRTTRIVAHRGRYEPANGRVIFNGAVTVTSSDGLVVTTESLRYDQQPQLAQTDVAISFRQYLPPGASAQPADGDGLAGRAIGARLSAVTRQLELLREVEVTTRRLNSANSTNLTSLSGQTTSTGSPIEIRSQSASYDELAGQIRFAGQASVVQEGRTARAATITGHLDAVRRRLVRIELRGDSRLVSTPAPAGRPSTISAPEIDFNLDEQERLQSSIARGATGEARAESFDAEGLPRSIRADQLNVAYRNDAGRSLPQQVTSSGRTTVRLEARPGTGPEVSVREVEADGLQALYREDGENLARLTARGRAVMTITPRLTTPEAERKRLRAEQFELFFLETGNRIRNFQAEGQVQADFEPLQPDPRRPRKSLSGRRLTASFSEPAQDLAEAVLDGSVRYVEADRTGTAARASWAAANRIVTLRGRPQLWDTTARTDAEEIDLHLDSSESQLRGRVRTTWFSRAATGDAVPFRNRQAPVTVVADRAVLRHPRNPRTASSADSPAGGAGGQAHYSGNVRAWQDNEFIRAEQLELDRGEKTLLAVGQAQSAYYQLEREVEKGRRQVVPVFATADRIRYNDGLRRTYYDGSVRIRQGTDLLEAATAEALMDEAHRLLEVVAAGRVVMTQPDRLAKGERVVYDTRDEKARLTGSPATIEDRQQQVLTRSNLLTIYLRDGRFEAVDQGGGTKRVRTTHRLK